MEITARTVLRYTLSVETATETTERSLIDV